MLSEAEEARIRNLNTTRRLGWTMSMDARFVCVKKTWLREMMIELAQ